MKVLFGEVPKEYEDHEGFKDPAGNEYYYAMDIEEEHDGNGTFSITDNCGRFIPFDFTSIDELVEVLYTLKEYRDDRLVFETYWKRIWSGQ